MEAPTSSPVLHTLIPSRLTPFNRVFAFLYTCAIFALLRHDAAGVSTASSYPNFFTAICLLISDVILVFMWLAGQSFRMRPVSRREYPEKLRRVTAEEDFPAVDVFVCTADPYKEPPISVANTALSAMAYDYPMEKLSVYVSDDGGSQLTLFALMEAAKFGRHWLGFCRRNKILERCPDAYFISDHARCSEEDQMRVMYESMRERVEKVVNRGEVEDEYVSTEEERQAFNKWTPGSSRHDHPAVIQVLLENGRDEDVTGRSMPNLVYVSREKSRASPHHFKAGALNALLRVSAVITNAPIILNLDCDNYSNDPKTLHRVLCYFMDHKTSPILAYVQFPQRFPRLDKDDIYACELKRMFDVQPRGMDGLVGPDYFGSGTFFSRRAFFGGPSSFITPETPELRPDHAVDKPIGAQHMALAHRVAGCNYDSQTNWGSKLGFRYGSLVEDFYTGYRLHCEGWRSVLCTPERAAFWGDAPITLDDALTQTRRWVVGLLEVSFSQYCPLTYGIRQLGPIMALCYTFYALGPILAFPITIYAFLPQLALLNGISIFPKVSCTWFFLYAFLFLGSYGQDCFEFILARGTFQRWWNDQRMWMVRGITCNLFGSIEYVSKCLGMSTQGFNVTSKVVNDEQSKTYEKGVFEFGVESPMFVPLAATSMINLASLIRGLVLVSSGGDMEGLFVQVFISGFVVLNCWPVYEAMALRRDKGRIPMKITLISAVVALALYAITTFMLNM